MGWGADFPTGQGFSQPLVDGRFILQSGNNNFSELNDPAVNELFDQAIAGDRPGQGRRDLQADEPEGLRGRCLPALRLRQDDHLAQPAADQRLHADAYNGRYDYASLGVVK